MTGLLGTFAGVFAYQREEPMKVLQLSTILLLVVTSTSGQEHTVRKPLAAAISCTTEVPAKTCTIASGTFHAAQQASKAMFSVKVVLADERAFQQESDEEKKKFDISARSSSSSVRIQQRRSSPAKILGRESCRTRQSVT